MLKRSILTVVIGASFLGGCGSDSDDQVEMEPVNLAPTVSADFAPLVEKGASTLSVLAQDSDGRIASYAWTQTAGPELEFTGGDTATISFTAPSVSVDTQVSFSISVTDDAGEVTKISADTNIARIETIYNLSGQVVGVSYAGSLVSASVGAESAEAEADASGQFTLNLAVDDDVPVTSSVKLTAGSDTGLQLVSLIPSLTQLSGFTAQSIGSKKQRVVANSEASLSVSAVSTALYSLLVMANGGIEPSNLDAFELVESQVEPDALIEAAAVVQILINSEQNMLPEGADLIEVLADPNQYNALVEVIEAATPGAIEAMVSDIMDDPTLTPPLETSDVAPVYYQTYPVAASFIARGGSRYEFNTDNTGVKLTGYGEFAFKWMLEEGDLLLTYEQEAGSISFMDVDLVPGLTQEQKDALYEVHIYQVETWSGTVTERMKRIASGAALDSFRVEEVYEERMTPIELETQVISVSPWGGSNESDVLMRKSSPGNVKFTSEEIAGFWGLEIYQPTSYRNNTFEVLEFLADGTGVSEDTGAHFDWATIDGRLELKFDTFNQSFSVIDSNNGNLAVYSEVSDKEGKLLVSLFGYATQIAPDIGFNQENLVTGKDSYWQTMVNQWTPGSWDGDKLHYCYENQNEDEEEGECDWGSVFFGFQVMADNTTTRYFNASGMPPGNINYERSGLTWSVNDDGEVVHSYDDSLCEDKNESCRQRTWRLLKIEDGRLGKRIYVQESDRYRSKSTDEWRNLISPRWNMYELLDLEYFNAVTTSSEEPVAMKPQGMSPSIKTEVSVQRKILEPTSSVRQMK